MTAHATLSYPLFVHALFYIIIGINFVIGDNFGADVIWETRYEGLKAKLLHQYLWSASEANHVEIRTNLTLANFFYGKLITIEKQTLVDSCPLVDCPICKGKKFITQFEPIKTITKGSVSYPCPACAGFGKAPESLPCFELGIASISSGEETIKLFVPPGGYRNQVLEYQPFRSKFVSIASTPDRYFHPSDFGKLKVVIEDVSLHSTNPMLAFSEENNLPLTLQVKLSSKEALFGFEKEFHLLENCEPLVISRNKPVLPKTNITLSPIELYRKLCRVPFEDHEDLLWPVNHYHEAPLPVELEQFRIEFPILTESEEKKAFLDSWNCTYVESEPRKTSSSEETGETSDTVFCSESAYPEERNAAFQSFRTEQTIHRKYRSWLEFLSRM